MRDVTDPPDQRVARSVHLVPPRSPRVREPDSPRPQSRTVTGGLRSPADHRSADQLNLGQFVRDLDPDQLGGARSRFRAC